MRIFTSAFIFVLALTVSLSLVSYADVANGEKIFKKKCKACHRLSDGTKVGPGLLGVTNRRTEEWIDEWIHSPKAMLAKGDPIAVGLKKKFKKTMRTLKKMQVEENRRDVILFLKQNDAKLEDKQTTGGNEE